MKDKLKELQQELNLLPAGLRMEIKGQTTPTVQVRFHTLVRVIELLEQYGKVVDGRVQAREKAKITRSNTEQKKKELMEEFKAKGWVETDVKFIRVGNKK
jgi:hypothetical protein